MLMQVTHTTNINMTEDMLITLPADTWVHRSTDFDTEWNAA